MNVKTALGAKRSSKVVICPFCDSLAKSRKGGRCRSCGTRLIYAGESYDDEEDGFFYDAEKQDWVEAWRWCSEG